MDITLTLGAGGLQEIQTVGRYYYVYAAPDTVGLRFSGGDTINRESSQGGRIPKGSRSVRITSATAQTITIIFSDEQFQNDLDNISVSTSATIAPGNTLDNGGDVALPAIASTAVRGADANALAVILKADEDNTVSIRVGTIGVGAAGGYPLGPGESVTIATTAALAAYNPHATIAQNIHVLPIREV